MICGSGWSKSRLAKAAGAEPCRQMRHKKLHAAWCEAHLEVKKLKTFHVRSNFRSWKRARRSSAKHISKSKVQKTDGFEPLLEVEMSKKCTPRSCGAKQMSKSKCTKHTNVGALLEVETSRNCTLLWREAHFEVKSVKAEGFGPLLDVQMSFCGAGARDCAPWGFCSSFSYNNHKYNTQHFTTLHYTTLHYITLHYTTPHYTPLHPTTLLHYTTLHYTKLHYTTLHYTSYSTLHYSTFHYTTFHFTTLYYTLLQCTTLITTQTTTASAATTKAATALQ